MVKQMTSALACLLCLTAGALAADSKPLPKVDWSAWQQIPVLDDGRIKPLDTFAEEKVTLITGRTKWKELDDKGNTVRTYKAPELLYAWITAQDEWIKRKVIRCEYRPLRVILLGEKEEVGTYIAVNDFIDWEASHKGGGLVFRNPDFQKRMESLYEELSKSQKSPGDPQKSPGDIGETAEERRFNARAAELVNHTREFLFLSEGREIFVAPGLDPRVLTEQVNPRSKTPPWVSLGGMLKLDEWKQDNFLDVTAIALMAPNRETRMMTVMNKRLYDDEELSSLPQLDKVAEIRDSLLVKMREIKPALDASRKAYDQLASKGNASEFEKTLRIFSTTLRELAVDLDQARRKMGPLSKEELAAAGPELQNFYKPLPLDETQMAITAYPPPGALDLEIRYNSLQPFYLSCWFYGLASLPLLAAWLLGMARSGMGNWSRSLYIIGLGVTTAAMLFATYGFALRIMIAGRPPVTNMYETVIWVSYVVSCLGLWFGILPLIWPGLEWSWRLTAIPGSWEVSPHNAEDENRIFYGQRKLVGSAAFLLRLAGFVGVMMVLTQAKPFREYSNSFKIISLTPPMTGTNTVSFGSLLTWLVGIVTVLAASWYLPRAALAVVGSVITGIPEARKKSNRVWEQIFTRQFFLIGSIPVALFGMVLAAHVGNVNPEILNPRIGSIAAVLRNNYWLTIHVLTIVSSYGAGALAWGLGNLAMFYYLFGSYNKAGLAGGSEAAVRLKLMDRMKSAGKTLSAGKMKQAVSAGIGTFGQGDDHLETNQVRPPQEVATIAQFSYKAMQVAVLLLAVGTILGGLWADVSWGRFWDWDPKEVWALISLLAYLVFLHGRYAGWVGTFGTNAGSVLCFQAIMMSWYGVNFVLPQVYGFLKGTNMPTAVGMHSYATGSASGIEWVGGACALNLFLVFLAWTRYTMETISAEKAVPAQAAAAAVPPTGNTVTAK
ncbi:MAG: cytochrome c biogenesis protein CcsA [Planctomycetaceae bacterium]|nr:cytochrome c biogenesis protein CcsA [Planctomycetaceae bacterium]